VTTARESRRRIRFDDLVGLHQQQEWHREAEDSGGLATDYHVEHQNLWKNEMSPGFVPRTRVAEKSMRR
jgi:hypothetical protein